jgi:Bacterial PH domain/Protein of unknown function (DUF2510)
MGPADLAQTCRSNCSSFVEPERVEERNSTMSTSYIDKNLQPGELVTYRGRPSKSAVLIKPAVLLVLFAILGSIDHSLRNSVATTSSQGAKTSAELVVGLLMVLIVIAVIINTIGAVSFLGSAQYVVTDRRVVAKYGLIKRSSVDLVLTHVSGVRLLQGGLGRLLGFGNVLVHASGADRRIAYVKNPKGFQSAILAQLEESRLLKGTAAYRLDVTPPTPAANSSSAETPLLGSAVPLPPGTSARWAIDPFDQASMRYWDGDRWTDHVAPSP